MGEQSRSNKYRAFALIENRGNKLAVIDYRVPVFWMKSMAVRERDKYNMHSPTWLRVEPITIEREKRHAKNTKRR
jgi:hypothetical protein